MRKYKVILTGEERKELETIVQRGNHRAGKVINALVLLNCDRGQFQSTQMKNEDIAAILRISRRKIGRIEKRFFEEGLEAALTRRKGGRVYKKKTDGEFEARLIALSYGNPPDGFARWSYRLLAAKAVELHYIDGISYETVRCVLKKRNNTLEKRGMGYPSGR